MYKKVDTTLNFVDREKEVLEFWRENKVFEKTKTKNGTDQGRRGILFLRRTAHGKRQAAHRARSDARYEGYYSAL